MPVKIPEGQRVGVRGTGSIGLRHLRVLRDELGIVPVAFPVRESRAAEVRGLGFDVVTRLDAPDAGGGFPWIVATDTARHLDDALGLLAFGDLLMEKPLSPTAAGLGSFSEYVRASDRRVFVGFPLRFDAALQAFRRMLPEIGRVDSVRIECQSYLPDWRPGADYRRSYSAREAEGGVLRDLSHEVDYAAWLFGRPSEVSCHLSNTGRLGIEAEEAADLFWLTPGGAYLTLRLDYLSRIPRRGMRAVGELGEVEWDGLERVATLRLPGEPERVERSQQSRDEMLAHQALAFLYACGGEDPGSLASLDEGAFVVALSDAARESSGLGRPVVINDWRDE